MRCCHSQALEGGAEGSVGPAVSVNLHHRLRQDKSTGTCGPHVLDDVGLLQGPCLGSRPANLSFPNENKRVVGTISSIVDCHAA